jgi:hypothetical protein
LVFAGVASLRAGQREAIDPASVDDVTLALARLAIETKADEFPDRAYAAASDFKNRCYGPAQIAPDRIADDREVDALARRTRMCQIYDMQAAVLDLAEKHAATIMPGYTHIIHNFVLASREQKIPATEARADLLDAAAQEMIGKKIGMTDARLRELLDPVHFIKVTDSKGGAAPEEIARMIADRRAKLAEARSGHLKRIETLESAQKRLVADLKAAA